MAGLRWVNELRLRRELRQMSRRSRLYRLLKEELSKRGWWKLQRRGKPGNPGRR